MGVNVLASTVSGAIERLGLTYEEVGDIVDASPRSVARWTAGQVVPQRLNKQRLIELAYVADALAEVLPRDQANVWMFRRIGYWNTASLPTSCETASTNACWRSSTRWRRECSCERCPR
ncbi:transcriptional regulator [Mycobacterium tuberculosis variant africanum]|nr:transcriptional regulator [Mycobacterium tuberculosis variant africanum]